MEQYSTAGQPGSYIDVYRGNHLVGGAYPAEYSDAGPCWEAVDSISQERATFASMDEAVRWVMDQDKQRQETRTMDRNEQYFQHYAEVLSDELGTVTIVRIEGNDCLYEYDTGTDVFRGWWRDGNDLADIKWQVVEQA